ncbi:MAG TPA: ABC transporter permease subunit [Acidimicrobiales bacterium]|nr:MAG: hypothetical protein B7Z69_02715 [Actinobacteria bacterium 21-73-9]HQU25455.1 ABC transporter permease subunit [Acidimicrobiales bacterium]
MAWRLQRSVFLFFVAAALVLIAYAVVSGLHVDALRHQWLGEPCHGGNGFAKKYLSLCQGLNNRYFNAKGSAVYVHWFAVLPTAVLGLLLGATVVAGEVDRNTIRVAWTQSISRGRWFATKVAVALGSLVVLAIPLGVTVTWFLRVSQWTPRISTDGFTYGGWMPLAIGVFAFAVTTIVGTFVRRPGWTLAAGLVVMALVAWAMQNDVRAHLVPLRSTTIHWSAITKGDTTVGKPSDPAPANAWVLFNGYVPVGHRDTLPTSAQATTWMDDVNRCPANFAFPARYATCLKKLGLHEVEMYVADSEYWTLQLREGGLYLAGAALLLGANLVRVRRTTA